MTQASPPDGPGYNHNWPQPPAGTSAGTPATTPATAPPPVPVLPDEPPSPTTEPPVDEAAADPAVRRSRFGGLWVGLIVAAVVLVLLLIFILQNSQNVQVDYFGLSGHLPLAVAILLGVAAGALLVALPGTIRILQLRRNVRRH
ncbi:MAG TPA: LapA family protein [Actinophytocola sp.]|jgi:uncharacterized integral membrane protein|nr:LapA family protein [Actinophytocola sp.]